jgi:tetratricopeptide (TPR) repeat protein
MSSPLVASWRGFAGCLAAALLVMWIPHRAIAHGDLHGQIDAVTRQIRQTPSNAELYFKRAELHRAHSDWDASLADFETAASLNPQLRMLDLARGRMLVEAGWPRSAIVSLDRFLLKHPKHVDALILRARAWVKQESYLEAAADYDTAIESADAPKPDVYLERAEALRAAGARHIPRALGGLDEGMRRLGPLVVLQLRAIELELDRNDFEAALQRIDQAAAKAPRKETWLLRRGEVLARAGRIDEARESLSAALAALETLPTSRRNVPAMVELEARITSLLHQLSASVPVEPALAKPE